MKGNFVQKKNIQIEATGFLLNEISQSTFGYSSQRWVIKTFIA